MKQRLKGLLALVLSLVMVFALATNAWAMVRIGGQDISENTYWTYSDNAWSVGNDQSYNVHLSNNTLTLNEFVYNGNSNIYSDGNLTLNLIGNNAVTYGASGAAAVHVTGNLTIKGDNGSSLTVSGTYPITDGIHADNVTIESGTVTATGGEAGISANNNVVITGGTVKATGDAYGIFANNVFNSGGMKVTISGGSVEAYATDGSDGIGIYAPVGEIAISGTNTKVTVGCATGLKASTVNILESSIVKINADDTAIISDTLNMDGNWYQWTDDSNSVQKSSDTNQLDATKAADTSTLIIEKIVQPPATCTVTFDLQGYGTMTTATQTDIPKGDKVTEPNPAPSANGWTFGGWYKEAACTNAYDFNSAVNSSFTLYAKWTENSATPQPSYNYPIYIPTVEDEPEVTAPKTFDGGIASAVVVTILSATGGAWLAKKKD